jgi:hypothetical protein
MKKIAALFGLIGILLAVVAAFVAIPGISVPAALVILGVVAGIGYAEDRVQGLLLAVLVYPVVAIALHNVPAVGEQLGAIFGNIGVLAAGVAAAVLTARILNIAKLSVGALTGK